MLSTVSSSGYGETVTRLLDAITQKGLMVFAQIDHAAAAREAGMDLPDEVVIVFGNPRAGTGLMQADPRVGIELPLRMLVWNQDGRPSLATTIRRASPAPTASRRRPRRSMRCRRCSGRSRTTPPERLSSLSDPRPAGAGPTGWTSASRRWEISQRAIKPARKARRRDRPAPLLAPKHRPSAGRPRAASGRNRGSRPDGFRGNHSCSG
jgi:uncharacterized protein (DUF302 family)